MVSEPSIAMASSSTTQTMNSASSLEISLLKSHLPDVSIKLTSNNYLMWKAQVIPVLRGYGLLGYVKNKVPCPASTITGESADGPLSQVINSESSHDEWQVLETLYGTHNRDRIQQIKGELQTLTKGSEFDPIVAALNARDIFPSLEGVIGKLRDFEIRIQGARTTAPSMAFYTNRGRTNPKPWMNHDGCFAPEEEADQYKAFTAIKIGETTEEPWYFDIGANQHMTSDTNEVQGIISYPGHESVMVGNGQDLSITGTGHIILPTTKLKLNDVLVVPEIKKRLLFVSQFTRDNNCYFLFYPWGFILKDMKTKQQTNTHASQLFKIKTIPRLLKIVVETPATQNNHHILAVIDQDTGTTRHESAAIVPDESASLFISPGTTSGMHNLPTETSLTPVSAPPRRHHMITRAQTGNLKPKVFMSSRHPIPACLVADLVEQP
ncbi:hypothetical protein SADUNF_Sadunf03G0031700 [Salix dunnii]|uniref:Retrovirus-related Pol polyprotein from transposon TNT 1-94-like beta-barrel domain-containing protein n=1 Tax=Salix dunnii TaxID=1413687 RepID=A0A835K6T4_9ROSI|nr:hypothetical protein SADUNF_Sadunf03G0031700 [Salix dunnii]